ncbi:uncharacterized protein LOC142545628 isoform X2 [Primulina tabacum]|uniref:uncharacterized protein LOC142545628 isoform X2 n=1 Tax=Primulina tabacum TaxID=48773 RepID=UPI003F5A753B
MPGTIQVSVLEFKGISSSSDPSATSVKVSIGKRCYRTQDKGDFSFEELAVTLVDEEGNEIAYTGIRIMQIIQKGTWDDIFSLEGGGQVHLKLRFFLNEEEKNRIRVMRESAMKKNLATASNINLNRSESTSSTRNSEEKSSHSEQNVLDSQTNFVTEVVSREAEASPADSPSSSEASFVGSPSSYQKEEIIQEIETPNAADCSQGASLVSFSHVTETQSSRVPETTPTEKIETALPIVNSKDPDLTEKVPSNVRKMISAFESGQFKDVKSLKRPTSVLQDEKDVAQSTNQSLRKAEVAHLTENLSRNLNVSGQEDLVSSDSLPFPDLKESKSSVAPLEYSEITSEEPTVEESNRSPDALTSSNILEQDVEKYFERAASAQLEQNIAGKEGSSEDKDEKGVTKLTDQSSREFEDTFFTGYLNQMIPSVSGLRDLDSSHTEASLAPKDLESTVAPVEISGEESDRSPFYLTRQPVSETATCSGRESEVQSQEIEAYDSSDSSAVEEAENETQTGLEGSKVMDIQGTSDQKPKSLDFDKEEYNSPESSGLWIFPHNLESLCITTAGNQVMKIVELLHIEPNTHQENEVSMESEILEQQHEIREVDIGNMPESGSFPDDSCNRLIGQAIKIAVILGFGLLVLLTQKKEPRKKKSEENDFLCSIPNQIDERTLTV